MSKFLVLTVLAAVAFGAGCSSPSSDVSPEVDNKIRDNLSRPLNAEELKQMGGGGQQPTADNPGSQPAVPPPSKGPKGGGAPSGG